MTHLPLCNIPFNDSTLPINCNNKSQQSQFILRIFRFTVTNERHYILLFINKVLYYMDSPFRCIEIPYYDFVIYDLCDCLCPPFIFVKIQNIIKNTKFSMCEKILFIS